MNDRLELFRAARPDKRFVAFVCLATVLALGMVGNSDFADALDREADAKLARVEIAKRRSAASPAPIWSSRCASRGQTFIAQRADGGPWRVACNGKRTRS